MDMKEVQQERYYNRIMDDIKISDNKDVELVDGDFPKVSGIDRIIQHIDTALHILPTDWCLDYTQGVNYILGMRGYPEIMSSQIKQAIASVEGVDMVLKYNFYEGRNRTFYVSATVKVGNSEIPINKEINPSSLI